MIMLRITSIAGSMAISSGLLLVLGPWYATSHSVSGELNSLYFFSYITITIIISSFFGFILDQHGGRFGLQVSTASRLVFISFTFIALIKFNTNPKFITISLALLASIPDSLYRISIDAFLKETLNSQDILKGSSLLSAVRQVGYIAGTSIGGIILTTSNGIEYLMPLLFLLGMISLTLVNSTQKKYLHSTEKGAPRRSINIASQIAWLSQKLSNNRLQHLFISLIIFGIIGYVLPMNAAPLILKVKNLSSLQLGEVESVFSIGTFIGSLSYAKYNSRPFMAFSFVAVSGALLTVAEMPYPLILIGFTVLGFFLNATIPLEADFIRRCPEDIIGRLSGFAALTCSIFSALILGLSSLGIGGNPATIYIELGFIVLVTFIYLIFSKGTTYLPSA